MRPEVSQTQRCSQVANKGSVEDQETPELGKVRCLKGWDVTKLSEESLIEWNNYISFRVLCTAGIVRAGTDDHREALDQLARIRTELADRERQKREPKTLMPVTE